MFGPPPAAGNLTGSNVDPAISKVLDLLPGAHGGPAIPGVNDLLNFPSPDNLNGYTWTGTFDHRLTAKHHLSLRYPWTPIGQSKLSLQIFKDLGRHKIQLIISCI